jgi:hypothetical protein
MHTPRNSQHQHKAKLIMGNQGPTTDRKATSEKHGLFPCPADNSKTPFEQFFTPKNHYQVHDKPYNVLCNYQKT